jgi:methylmalonyl-CoA mutase N-terminal domain/subunit
MTINGPAPMLLGFFMNAAIDQNVKNTSLKMDLQTEVEEKSMKFTRKKEQHDQNTKEFTRRK